jgi:hypothetical protein
MPHLPTPQTTSLPLDDSKKLTAVLGALIAPTVEESPAYGIGTQYTSMASRHVGFSDQMRIAEVRPASGDITLHASNLAVVNLIRHLATHMPEGTLQYEPHDGVSGYAKVGDKAAFASALETVIAEQGKEAEVTKIVAKSAIAAR